MIALYNQYEYNAGFVARLGQAQKNVISGTTVTYNFAVTNTSTVADSFSFVCRSAWPCTITTPASNVALAPNQATTVQLTISVPADAARGAGNTAQLNVLRANRAEFSRNFTAVTVSNGPPITVNNDSYSTNQNTLLRVAAPGVLGNDSDAENDPLTAVLVRGPAHGTLTLNADGSFRYQPATNYSGNDSFTYKANDGKADSPVATVQIKVVSVASQLTQLEESVWALIANRTLSPSQGLALIRDLRRAKQQLAKGNVHATITELREFIAQVREYIAFRKLTSAQGQPLIRAARAIISSLGGFLNTEEDADADAATP